MKPKTKTDSAKFKAPAIQTQEPEVSVQQVPELSERQAEPVTHFWPAKEPLPDTWAKPQRRLIPCPKCRRTQLPDGGQAAACASSGAVVAFFRCRACGHRWKLAVKGV